MFFFWPLPFFSDFCIKTNELFEFLDEASDGWPKWSATRKRTNNENWTWSDVLSSKSHENAVKKEVTERNKGVKGEVKESHEDTAKDEANESRKFGTTDEVISPEWMLSETMDLQEAVGFRSSNWTTLRSGWKFIKLKNESSQRISGGTDVELDPR